MKYNPPEIYIFPEEKKRELKSSIFWGKVMAFIWGMLIFFFIGFGVGQWWRIAQVEPEKDAKIQKMQNTIEYYRTHYTPINPKEIQSTKGAGQLKKGKRNE